MTNQLIKELETLCKEQGYHPSELISYVKGLIRHDPRWKGQSADHLIQETRRNLYPVLTF